MIFIKYQITNAEHRRLQSTKQQSQFAPLSRRFARKTKRHRHAAAELAAACALRSQAHMVQGPLRPEALY